MYFQANSAPPHHSSVSHFKPQKKTATPVGHQNLSQTSTANIKASPVLQSFGAGGTPESVTSCSMETNSTFNSEENGDSRSSSTSAISSSYPSPEIFRRESNLPRNICFSFQTFVIIHGLFLQLKHRLSLTERRFLRSTVRSKTPPCWM